MPQFALPDEQTFKVLKAALSAGANVWSGADYYGTPNNNSLHLMKRFFTAYPEDVANVVLTIMTGIIDRMTATMDCPPAGLRKSVELALNTLDGKRASMSLVLLELTRTSRSKKLSRPQRSSSKKASSLGYSCRR